MMERNKFERTNIVRLLHFIKFWSIKALCQITRVFPIRRNRVVCISHVTGGMYSDSPMYITERLLQKHSDELEIIWVVDDFHKFQFIKDKGIKLVRFHSLKEVYYSNTAGVYITNLFGPRSYVVKRAHKLVIDTTHGVAYKALLSSRTRKNEVGLLDKLPKKSQINTCSLCLSGNKITTDKVYRHELGYRGKILEQGLPRNDVFFSDTTGMRDGICRKLGLRNETKFVLVMPTWRKDQDTSNIEIDFQKLIETLERQWGGNWVVLLRLHHFTSGNASKVLAHNNNDILNVTKGFEAQTLLCAADMLITDYSSVIWDFALRKLPILLFQPDLDDYDQERGFNVPPSEWNLFSASTSNELISVLENHTYNELCEASRKHLEKFGCCETGHATEAVCDIIDAFINGEEMA